MSNSGDKTVVSRTRAQTRTRPAGDSRPPANRLAQWLGWGLCAVAVAGAAWGEVNVFNSPLARQLPPVAVLAEILFRLFPVAFAILSALIISRQPANIIGWLLVLPVIGGIATNLTSDYLQTITSPTVSPLLLLVVWLDNTLWLLFVFPILLIPLLFPTGRPPTPRWNWVGVYALGMVAFFLFLATTDESLGPNSGAWTINNPLGLPITAVLEEVAILPWVIALAVLTLVCIAALVVRYRRGSREEKAQIKWVAYASALFGLAYVAFLPNSDNTGTLVASIVNLVFSLTLFGIPLSIGIAILHYRLWDIDFVINRSLVYGALTGLLALLFGASLLVVNSLAQNHSGGPLVAVAIAAAVFGGLFQPARRWLQRFVDRRFYNIQIDYNRTPVLAAVATQVFKHTNFGQYQNLELIGQGGMAEVYKSVHPVLGTPVAIKILPAHLATDPNFRNRFMREAKIMAGLQHPHIIKVFDHGEAGGTHYIVMEYIGGKDLGAYLEQQGRLSLAEARPLLKGLAEALDYAHGQDLIHRDIKPSNVLLDAATAPGPFRPVLTDFGIAKMLSGGTRFTETGGMLGTYDYIAPEQIQGAANVDGRADIYAFGVMVFQLLTGVLPFQHQNPGALLMAHMMQPPPDAQALVPHLPSETAEAIQRAMAKAPAERFETAGAFVAALG